MGTLYLVSTPIGNLRDVTLRAIAILRSVDIIACEDTRKTGLLLKRLAGIRTKDTPNGEKLVDPESRTEKGCSPRLISYYEQNEASRIPEILSFLQNGLNVALVTNAGTPTISDPGFKLVRECIQQKLEVVAVPGPSAVITALAVSGLPTDKFLFLGFLPKKEGKRIKILKDLSLMIRIIRLTVIIYASPHRLAKELKNVQEVFGNLNIVLCCELTKLHEKVRREKINETLKYFQENKPRGEFTLLFNLPPRKKCRSV